MLTRSWMVVCALAVSLCSIAGASAQSQQARPSPEAIAAAQELVASTKASEQLKALMPIFLKNMRAAMLQGRPQMAQDYDAVVAQMLSGLNERLSEFTKLIALVYANNFSVDELHEIAAFYRTPIGQKLLERQPVIAQQSMQAGQAFARALFEDLKPRIIQELRKRGHDI